MLKPIVLLSCLALIAPAEARAARHKHTRHDSKQNAVTRSLDPEHLMEQEAETATPETAAEQAQVASADTTPPLGPEPMYNPRDGRGLKSRRGKAFRGGVSPQMLEMIERHARQHGIPSELLHRIIIRESRYEPNVHHRAYWGLMQIRHDTAQSMGYRGPASGLLNAETNLTYGVPYLANAYLVAGHNQSRAVALYAGGYYYEAKRKHLLGNLRTASSGSAAAEPVASSR